MKKALILLGTLVLGLTTAGLFGSVASAAKPPPKPLPPDRQTVLAPIESIEVVPSGSAPTGHALHIVAGLPGGCAEPEDYDFERYGDVFIVTVTNTMPADEDTICTKEYRTYDVTIDLGTDFVPDQEYIAYVNGQEFRFIAHGGIVPPDKVEVPAPIESVDITATLSLPPQYIVNITAGLPGSCSEPANAFVNRAGNEITIDVTNWEPAEQTVCAPIYTTYPLYVNIGSDFEFGQTYTVNVNGIIEEFTAY